MRVRGLVALLLIAAMCWLVAGCGDTQPPDHPTDTTVCYPLWDACLAPPQTIERID